MTAADGKLFGFVVPLPRSGVSSLSARPDYPFDSDRERAILAERMATLDDTVSLEELKRRVEATVQRLLASPSPGSEPAGLFAAPHALQI